MTRAFHTTAVGAPCTCSAMLSARDARMLTLDELRRLATWTTGQRESLWDDLDAQAILDCYWAAHDEIEGGGYVDWESFMEEAPKRTRVILDAIRAAQGRRPVKVEGVARRAGSCDSCERCTWNPGPDCQKKDHPHCPTCGHCEARHEKTQAMKAATPRTSTPAPLVAISLLRDAGRQIAELTPGEREVCLAMLANELKREDHAPTQALSEVHVAICDVRRQEGWQP